MAAEYDIINAFYTIEDRLINSMIRNFKRHRAEETELGINWTQWQVEQLNALEEYARYNRRKYGKQFKSLNKRIAELLKTTYADAETAQEREILEAITKGFTPAKTLNQGVSGTFFKTNERKLDALIKATTNDFEKAEYATLRLCNDEYRKIIFNAQVAANTGALTYEQAVDMAAKDFEKSGINSITYSNGARHDIADYSRMAIRTANKRAALMGAGSMRDKWGEHLVTVNKRHNACPKCAQYVGKIFIDDVYSGGTKEDGDYPLLSEAIEGGLFHPNCKDGTSTYYPRLSELEEVYPNELTEMEKREQWEIKRDACRNQAEKYERMAKNSLDDKNKRKYKKRASEFRAKEAEAERQIGLFADATPKTAKPIRSNFTQASTIEEAQQYAQRFCNSGFMAKTFKGKVDFSGISLDNANAINQALTDVFENVGVEKISGIKTISPKSVLGKKAFEDGSDAAFAYDPIQHGIYVNKDILKNKKSFSSYIEKSQESFDYVMENIDKLTGAQKELALTYKQAGRSLVDGKTVQGMVKHELGHHVQWTLLDAKTNNSIGGKMSEFAPRISGYANASKGEYLAESFSAYMNGEKNLIDPEYVKFIDSKRAKRK
jgi:hypothetical protein